MRAAGIRFQCLKKSSSSSSDTFEGDKVDLEVWKRYVSKTSLKGPLKLHDDDGAGSLKAEGRLRLGKPSPLLDPT